MDLVVIVQNPQTFGVQRFSFVWDVDSLRTGKTLSAAEIIKRVAGNVQSGSIVLFHNAALHTPEALPGIIEYLQSNGFNIVPVWEILREGEYEMDHTGKMCPAGSA